MMFQEDCTVIENIPVASDYHRITFSSSNITKNAKPGQFVQLLIKDKSGNGPFLRRPFSFHKISDNSFSVLYHVIGKGTQVLSNFKKNDKLNVIGPLGTGFAPVKDKIAILISGGCGTAPLYALEEELKANNIESHFFMGAKNQDLLLCQMDFTKIGTKLYISTDDGSKGVKDTIAALYSSYLDRIPPENSVIYSCGPKPMLKAVAQIAKEKGIPAQLSLEEHMACGIGACLGCVVKTKDGNKRVCKEGPVFNAGDIIWE